MDEQRKESGLHPLALERWLAGEQSDAERASFEARLDPAERAALQRDDAAVRERLFRALPPERFAARVRELATRAPTQPARRASAWTLGLAAAAAGALLLTLRPGGEPASPMAERELASERLKGLEPELRVYRQRGATVERLANGAVVRARDVVQLGYVRSGYGFGVLLSIDGRGTVTLHHPPDGAGSTALTGPLGERVLAEAYELDDAPAFERFVFVASDRPLSVEAVLSAARRLAENPARAQSEPLLLPERTIQRSLLVRKSEAR